MGRAILRLSIAETVLLHVQLCNLHADQYLCYPRKQGKWRRGKEPQIYIKHHDGTIQDVGLMMEAKGATESAHVLVDAESIAWCVPFGEAACCCPPGPWKDASTICIGVCGGYSQLAAVVIAAIIRKLVYPTRKSPPGSISKWVRYHGPEDWRAWEYVIYWQLSEPTTAPPMVLPDCYHPELGTLTGSGCTSLDTGFRVYKLVDPPDVTWRKNYKLNRPMSDLERIYYHRRSHHG